jgi:CDP-diacylglycerol--serine O-phosphatidyltransferase
MRKHIPNFISLLNLVSGVLAVYFILIKEPGVAFIFFALSLGFDFLDGLAARVLKSGSEIGKQLDSLADIVSFGLTSTAMVFMIFQMVLLKEPDSKIKELSIVNQILISSVLIIPIFAALRLAKFNLQKETDFFMGLPVPAFALFWAGIYFDMNYNHSFFGQSLNPWFLFGIVLITTIMMVIPLPMLSLKFKNLYLIDNFSRYLLILASIFLLAFTGIAGLPLMILTYILLSLLRILLT